MKFKEIVKLIECKFEIYYKSSYVGEFYGVDSISNVDWVLDCTVKSVDIGMDINCDPKLEIELIP